MRTHRRRDTGLGQNHAADHMLLGTHFDIVLNSFPEHKSQITLVIIATSNRMEKFLLCEITTSLKHAKRGCEASLIVLSTKLR